MNPYEEALDRMEHARVMLQYAEQVTRWAEEGYRAAEENLMRFERKPGVPLSRYRRDPPEYRGVEEPGDDFPAGLPPGE